jgi:TonB family protein
VADAERKAAEFAEATRAADAAAALAGRQREEEERIALARLEEAQAEQARAEQARIESEKAAAAEVERTRIEAERSATAEREKKETARRAEAAARAEQEEKELAARELVARQNAAARTEATESTTAPREFVSASAVPRESETGARNKFPVWQIGAGVVILGLLLALSWHHLRPHSHSDEENGGSAANSSQGSGAGSESTVPTTPGAQKSSSGANEPSRGSGSSSGAGTSSNAALGASSGSDDAPSIDARGSGAGGKRGDAAHAKRGQDTSVGVAENRAPNAANGAGKSPSATSKPPANNNANSNPSAGAASTNAAATPLRVNATEQEAKIENRGSPVYPAQAAQNHISGMVVLDVVVAKDGTVKSVAVTSGDPALTGSAVDAVKQRHYAPTLVNGLPVEVETTVSINYAIKDSPSPAVNGVNGGGDAANSAGQQAPCTLGSVTFKENGTMIIGTVPYAYSGNAKLATLAVVGFPVGSDKKRIAGVALAETTLPAAIGTAPFSMESRPSLNGGGATGEFVEVVVIVKSTGEALCGKLVPYLRNW